MRRAVRGGIRLKGLKSSGRWPSGNVRYYYRHTTPATPMPDAAPDSPEFLRAYAAAAAGQPQKNRGRVQHRTGTIGAGVRAWLASDAFLARAAETRAGWRRIAEDIETRYGKGQLADLRAKHIRQDIARLTPHPANKRLKCWRAMARWWVEAGLIDADPAREVRARKAPPSDGHPPWTAEEVEAFRAHWPIGTMQRLALELMHQTGASIADAVRLGPSHLAADGWLTYTRGKTRAVCTVPLLIADPPAYYPPSDHLRACLEVAPRHLTFLSTAAGAARSPKAAGQWFAKAARSAGIEKSAHGVRKRLAIHMAEQGASEAQRMAILGHDTTAQTRHYSKTADARRIIAGTKVDNSDGPVVKNAEK